MSRTARAATREPTLVVVWLLISSVPVGCTIGERFSPPAGQIEDVDEMRREVVARVPEGTPLHAARRAMESEGFECTVDVEESTSAGGSRHRIFCCREDVVDFWVSRRWMVSLWMEDDVVVDTEVASGLIGP